MPTRYFTLPNFTPLNKKEAEEHRQELEKLFKQNYPGRRITVTIQYEKDTKK